VKIEPGLEGTGGVYDRYRAEQAGAYGTSVKTEWMPLRDSSSTTALLTPEDFGGTGVRLVGEMNADVAESLVAGQRSVAEELAGLLASEFCNARPDEPPPEQLWAEACDQALAATAALQLSEQCAASGNSAPSGSQRKEAALEPDFERQYRSYQSTIEEFLRHYYALHGRRFSAKKKRIRDRLKIVERKLSEFQDQLAKAGGDAHHQRHARSLEPLLEMCRSATREGMDLG